ncbi:MULTISPECIES: beta-glucosidase [unclassified Aeromonas]|uniref:beta-glucosidase family protein n=1 Tax=unclassified Aeromonas TaxID=257493 RepID=UPI00084AF8C2|nr:MULTISPECIES: glycoside hydrolase family 3 C-terminal domain-containing protein [unclassified Aeromonas]OEC49293.1 glycosyl hydrolase [Aeromonas sp. ANNP30]OEC66709.1 glycosyl hydrolase [Aeromonas sp. ANP5]
MSNYSFTLNKMTIDEKITLLAGCGLWKTASFKHHGINSLTMTDGTYGVRYSPAQIDNNATWEITDFLSVVHQSADDEADSKGGSEALFGKTLPATCFPNGSSLACCWDRELVYNMGQALANECRALGVNILLGPGINIRRTPLSGRGYEYYSEDPFISGELAASLINGLQDNGVGASLKHFACNNSEYRRTEMDSIVDERTLHEIYLSAFKRAIDKSAPWTVMSSYNRLNGEQTSQSHHLLTEILRQQWGYQGLVISDWYGVKDRPAALLAGNDLAMPEVKRDKRELIAAIENQEISTVDLDKSCLRILSLLDKFKNYTSCEVDFKQHHQLAQKIAEESIVLLKNDDHTLPITSEKYKKIAIIGRAAHNPIIQGSGCATTIPYMLDRPLDEIMDIAGSDFHINYAVGAPDPYLDSPLEIDKAVKLAASSDLAVVFVNTVIGEDGENGDRKDLFIAPTQESLIDSISAVQKNLVVVLANSDSVVMSWKDKCKSIVETFFSGQGAGRAIANILFGITNPSGKLTVTVPNSLEETPAFLYYPGEGLSHYYNEGIYVGYRYYDKRKMTPSYPFGFGLSYTEFEYKHVELSQHSMTVSDSIDVMITLQNTGSCRGKEVVQLYIKHPQTELPHPPLALKGFAKVELEAGESKVVTITLTPEEFKSYHPNLHQWIIESGQYEIFIGGSSRTLPLSHAIEVMGTRHSLPLKEDNSLVQVIQNEQAFNRVVELVARKSNLEPQVIRTRLMDIAPELFCGLFVALTEFLGVEVTRSELIEVLN